MIATLRRLAKKHGVRMTVQVGGPLHYAIWWTDPHSGEYDIVGAGFTWGECCDVASQEMAAWPS